MKMSIEWHEQGRINMLAHIKKQQEIIDSMVADKKRLEESFIFKTKQIETAKFRGITEFDPEKFLVQRNKGA